MSESHDQWFAYFKYWSPPISQFLKKIQTALMISSSIQIGMITLGAVSEFMKINILSPGLIVNFEDWTEDKDRDPSWLSKMFEYSFIRLIKLTSHNQVSQFPQIIQQVVTQINDPSVSIKCWSTLPQWDYNNWMTVQPAHHLVLIKGYTYQGPWYDGDSYLSYRDPYALVDCWRNYFINEILEVTSELWKNYYFVGNTGRITVFTNKSYSEAINL